MKRFLSLFVVAVLALSLLATTAFAAGTAVTVSSATAVPGETVTISVDISGNTGFASTKFILNYDSSVLTIQDMSTDLLTGGAVNKELGIISFASATNVTDDGNLFTVTFQVSEDAASGSYAVSVDITKMNDHTLTAVNPTVAGGTVTVEEAPSVLPVPAKPYKITNVVSGVHVYWNAVDGVSKYGVWRSETGKDGTYKWLGNPTVPHFTDINAESGKTYYYRITSVDAATNTHSEKSEAIGITYVSTPDITSRANIAAGVKLGWEKIEGATGYAIYRKSYSGTDAWVRVGTISGNSTFTWTDTSVRNNNGEVYKYTIRALADSNMTTLSGCRAAGRTMVRLSSQVLTSAAKASTASILCKWTTSSRVTGYEVRFMVGDTVYKTFTIGNYKTGVKTFTDLKAGQTYTIQVRTYKVVEGVGSFYSDWSAVKTVKI